MSIWSAACATGQEPFSVALLLREHFPEVANWQITLIASDVSREVLTRASQARFNQIEINRGIPAAMLVKYFSQHGTCWHLRPDVVGMVKFQEVNLAVAWPALPRFDLVLLRNVMIYFDVETKKSILGRVGRLLRPDGYLLLGGAETTINLDDSYQRVEDMKSGFYQRRRAQACGVGQTFLSAVRTQASETLNGRQECLPHVNKRRRPPWMSSSWLWKAPTA